MQATMAGLPATVARPTTDVPPNWTRPTSTLAMARIDKVSRSRSVTGRLASWSWAMRLTDEQLEWLATSPVPIHPGHLTG